MKLASELGFQPVIRMSARDHRLEAYATFFAAYFDKSTATISLSLRT